MLMLLCKVRPKPLAIPGSCRGIRHFSNAPNTWIQQVKALPDWDLAAFRHRVFKPQIPATLPYTQQELPEACSAWFTHENNPDFDLRQQPGFSELEPGFWSKHEDVMVPLELTVAETATTTNQEATFHRHEAPLKILLTYLGNPQPSTNSTSPRQSKSAASIYLAQCDLNALPRSMQNSLPTPDLVKHTGKGDIYSSSLWLGRPPTYTPLHRDPNPNLFMQLAGEKHIRLFPPDIGNAIFGDVQDQLTRGSRRHNTPISPSIRGEEMMQGPESRLLHEIVWTAHQEHTNNFLDYALEARLGCGEALFIPKGWWHSVKGVGTGVTASANWWFR